MEDKDGGQTIDPLCFAGIHDYGRWRGDSEVPVDERVCIWCGHEKGTLLAAEKGER